MQAVDFAILDWIQANMRCGVLDTIMPAVTHLARAGAIWLILGFIMLFFKKTRLCGMNELLGLSAGFLLCNLVLKKLIARPRPIWLNPNIEMLVSVPTDYSFPSGHTTASFVAAVVFLQYDKRLGIPALILAGLIAFSRLYLYVHFPSDVLAGALIGIIIGLLSTALIRKIQKDREDRKAAA